MVQIALLEQLQPFIVVLVLPKCGPTVLDAVLVGDLLDRLVLFEEAGGEVGVDFCEDLAGER